jgi:hypothetical protein
MAGFSEKFYARLGLESGGEIAETLRAPVAAGLQRAIGGHRAAHGGTTRRGCAWRAVWG